MDVERNAGGGNKTARFFECQKFVASKQISIPRTGKHTERCLEHMRKITGNQSHAHDDIADSLEMACRATLIDGTILPHEDKQSEVLKAFVGSANRLDALRQQNLNSMHL